MVNLTEELPTSLQDSTTSNPPPWAIQLADGQTCHVYTGATTTVGGIRMSFGCDNGALYGTPDTGNPVMTIRYQAQGDAVLQDVPIAILWQ